jgi:phage terminase small subunit
MQSPYVAILNKQAELMVKIACEFGFTPAARSRSFSYSKSNSMLLAEPARPNDELLGWPT